jgi:hypothetical protein
MLVLLVMVLVVYGGSESSSTVMPSRTTGVLHPKAGRQQVVVVQLQDCQNIINDCDLDLHEKV